jgi:hypothetical protein
MSGDQRPDEREYTGHDRLLFAAFWLTTAGAFALGLRLMGGYLAREHARLTPVEGVLLWTIEAVGAFWFVRYGFRHVVLGESPYRADPTTGFWPVWLSPAAGVGTDLGLTGCKEWDEHAAYRRSVPVDGQLLAADVLKRDFQPPSYRLYGQFTDGDGRVWPFKTYLTNERLRIFYVVAIRDGRLPVPFPMRYDPHRQARFWVDSESAVDENRVHQLTAVPPVLLAVWLLVAGVRRLVKADLPPGPMPGGEVMPFVVSAGCYLLVGLTIWAIDGEPL